MFGVLALTEEEFYIFLKTVMAFKTSLFVNNYWAIYVNLSIFVVHLGHFQIHGCYEIEHNKCHTFLAFSSENFGR